MPTVRVERVAVQPYFLGLLGFDHLQLAYEPCRRTAQDDWFVIEGVRDPGPTGPTLGVQGCDGSLTLARANAASGSRLVSKIGTPGRRASTVIASGALAEQAWARLETEAREIDRQRLAYVAFAPRGGSRQTCNSSSVIATLLHRLGFELGPSLPAGTRYIPGIETVIDAASDGPALARQGLPMEPRAQTCQTDAYGAMWSLRP